MFDAETQYKKVLERSIAIQTLAPRKKNTKKSDSAYNSNIRWPVATPLTPVEIKHKPSTARALYHDSPVETPPVASTVVMETDTSIPLPDSSEVAGKSSGYVDDTSDNDLTTHTGSDEDFECSELEPTDDESDGLKKWTKKKD